MTATDTLEGARTEKSSGGFQTKLPKTSLGRWSMWLAVAFVVGFAFNMVLVGVVGASTDASVNEFSRTYLPYWGVLLMSVGFAAGAVGLIAIWKQKERSILTLLTIVPMVFVTLFLLGELLLPH